MIDAHTQLVGVIGWPVAHSLSPVMHNAVFHAFHLNWRYLPLPVRANEVQAAIQGLVALGLRGANVTVPHKQTVIPALSTMTPTARWMGAVNTLTITRAEDETPVIRGDNTDSQGFAGALLAGGYDPQGRGAAVVVGAGGAARAVVHGLLMSGSSTVIVLNRRLERAEQLVADLARHEPWAPRLTALPLTDEALIEQARTGALLVNTTPAGMWPHTNSSVWPDELPVPAHLTVFDLVYNPLETRLLAQARRSGAHTIDGLGMLVRQGALALLQWVSEAKLALEELVPIMRMACEQALGASQASEL